MTLSRADLQHTIETLNEEKAMMKQNLQLYNENLKLTVDSKGRSLSSFGCFWRLIRTGDLESRLNESKTEISSLRRELTNAQAQIVKLLSSPDERIQGKGAIFISFSRK